MPALVVRDQGYQPKMAERQDSQFQPNVPFTCTGKVAGLLRHDVMLYPPGSDRDNVFIVVPDSWTFLDKAAAAVTTMAPLLSTPQRQQASSASAAFRDVRCLFVFDHPWHPPAQSSTLGFGFALDRPPYAARETILP
ncbi:hypothetical protein HRG_013612 [Hirsutella rhossiliensis]